MKLKIDEIILDIGAKTIKKIKQIIDKSKTVAMEWTSWIF